MSREMAEICLFMYFQDGEHPPSTIFSTFWTTHDVDVDDLYFPCQWHNDPVQYGSDIAILQLHAFDWKSLIPANLGEFLGIFSPNIMASLQ